MSWLSQRITRHVQVILIGVFAVMQGVWAINIGLSIGFGVTAFTFFFASVLVSILIIRPAVPMLSTIDDKLKTTTSASGKWLCVSGAVGITVCMVYMMCASGAISALLSGGVAQIPRKTSALCALFSPAESVFTSFGWMHVIVGVGATAFPLLVAGCCALAGSLKDHALPDRIVDSDS